MWQERRLQALQAVADGLSDEVASKGAALAEATRELAARGTSGGGGGGAGGLAWEQLKADLQALRAQAAEHEEERRQWQAGARDAARRVDAAEAAALAAQQAAAADAARAERAQAALVAAEEAGAGRDRELLRLRQEQQALSGREARAGDAASQLAVTVEELRSQLKQRGDAVDTLTSEVRLLQRRLADVQAACDEGAEQLKDALVAVQAKGERLARAEREVEGLGEQLRAAEADKDRLEEHCQRLTRQGEAAARRAGGEREEARRLLADKEALEGRVEELRALVASMEAGARGQAAKVRTPPPPHSHTRALSHAQYAPHSSR
jgi:SWI/SNF-related matrix-associated actin-dependent regulator 1 of chromatin subfamily A